MTAGVPTGSTWSIPPTGDLAGTVEPGRAARDPAPVFRLFARSAPLGRVAGFGLVATALAGLAAALPRAGGEPDPLALVAWLVLIAPAAGFACGALGVRLYPWGLAVPAVWMVALVQVDLASQRDLVEPVWPGLLWTGLFAAGLGIGTRFPGRPWGGAGLVLLLGLAAAGLGIQGGLALGDSAWARTHPGLGGFLLELSPLAWAFDAAGWDWVHANPLAYRLSGVEWVPREPWKGRLAGPAVLVVGCIAAALSSALFRKR